LDVHLREFVAVPLYPLLRLLRRHQSPEGGDFSGGGKPQPFKGTAASPVDKVLVANLRLVMMRGQYALGQVEDLLEIHPPRNRQLSGVPVVLERCLVGMPVPPPPRLVLLC